METDTTTFVTKKLVKVTDSGPIMPLGGIYGPTLPQIMSVKVIAVLLQKGYHVTEILNNKTEVKLGLTNYNVDLNGDGGKSLDEVKRPNENINRMPRKSEESETVPEEKKEDVPQVKKVSETIKTEPAVENKITVSAAGGKADADNKRNDNDAGGLVSSKKGKPKADELTSK